MSIPFDVPGCYTFKYENSHLVALFDGKADKKSLRGFDPWSLAVLDFYRKENHDCGLLFEIRDKAFTSSFEIESFLRRVSFLAFNNKDILFEVIVNGRPRCLYTQKELFDRPLDEVIHEKLDKRSDQDTEGRLEKDLQTYLFWKGKGCQEERTNERLAVFGEDFFALKAKKLPILREFPTGIFKGTKSEANRVLPTNFIDIVTLNKRRELSLIEIKVNDPKLEVISQALDYALFFKCYYKKLLAVLKVHRFDGIIKGRDFVCYVANNYYHVQFESIKRYYSTSDKRYGFQMKQIILGYTREL